MNMKELWDPYADFQKSILPNGLSVYHNFWDRPWLKVGFVVHSGSFADIRGKEGTAHFVEHMMSKNIKGVSRKDAELFFRRIGGSAMFGSTGPMQTSYWFVIPAKPEILTRSLEIFGNMLLECSFDKYLERERNVILCEFGNRFPFGLMYDLYEIHKRKMLYEGLEIQHFKGNLGDKESIAGISKDDLLQYHALNYVPQNMSVVVVGGMKNEDFMDSLDGSIFSKNINGARRPLPQKCCTTPGPIETKYELVISELVNNTPINIASYESFVAIPGTASMKMLELFSGMMNHILDSEIRQRLGATYDIGLNITDYGQVKELRMGGKVSPAVIGHMNDIIEIGLGKIKNAKKLFSNIKTAKLSKYLLLDVSGHRLMEDSMEDLELHHHIFSLREEIALIDEVKFSDVCALADYVADAGKRWTLIEYP